MGCDLQIAVFLLLSLFWTKTRRHHQNASTTTTTQPRHHSPTTHEQLHQTATTFKHRLARHSPTTPKPQTQPASIASRPFFLFPLSIADNIGVWTPDWRGGGSFLVRYKSRGIRGTKRREFLSSSRVHLWREGFFLWELFELFSPSVDLRQRAVVEFFLGEFISRE